MALVLFILAALAFGGGALLLDMSETALHEIEAGILFLISAVLLAGGAVVHAIGKGADAVVESLDEVRSGMRKQSPPQA